MASTTAGQGFVGFRRPETQDAPRLAARRGEAHCRRHLDATPRTVFGSKTDHVMRDRWWLCTRCNHRVLVQGERIPWDTRTADVMDQRRPRPYLRDPLSHDYMLLKDRERSIRLERECPNPIRWPDYTRQERGPRGSAISHTKTPHVDIRRSPWVDDGGTLSTILTLRAGAGSADYAMALWGLPDELGPRKPIEANAREHILARKAVGEHHLVLVFDLWANVELTVRTHRR